MSASQDETGLAGPEDKLKLFSAALESAIDGIQIVDFEGRIIFSNKAVEHIYGYTSDELLGKHVNDMNVDPEFASEVILPGIQRDGYWSGELMVKHKDGNHFPIWLNTSLVKDNNGEAIAMVGVIRDITERRKMEESLIESEHRFRAAFENAAVGASMVDLKGRFLKVNKRLCDMLGYSENELLTKTFSDITFPDDIRIGLENLKRQLEGESDYASFEKRYVRKDGQVINVIVSPSLIRSKDGAPQHFVGLWQDITERKRAEEAIKESEERMRLLIESAQDIIIMQDIEGRYSYYNANPSYGLKAEDLLGKSPEDFHDKKTAEKIMDRFRRVIKSNESIAEEVQINWQGELLWMHEQTSPVKDSDGNVRGVVTISRNITEMKRLEEQLRHSQKMEAIGTLTAGIAHEFFNILTAIKGSAEFLDSDISNDSPLKSYVNVIQTSVERATRLTQSLLMYSRKQLVKMETMALDDVAEHVGNLIATLAAEDIRLDLTCKDKGLEVIADKDQLEQVLMNLAVNAIDAMPDGGTLTINIEAADFDKTHVDKYAGIKPGRYALLSVSDTGIGMDMKTQEKMFEPFFTTKGVGKGTGLGLSMVYGIIKKHNGYITVISNPGKGTTFKIYLPLT